VVENGVPKLKKGTGHLITDGPLFDLTETIEDGKKDGRENN
jgi:hypothetical protein